MTHQYPHDPNQPNEHQWGPINGGVPPQHQAPKRKHTGRKIFLGIGVGVVALVVAAVLSPSEPAKQVADKLPNVVTSTVPAADNEAACKKLMVATGIQVFSDRSAVCRPLDEAAFDRASALARSEILAKPAPTVKPTSAPTSQPKPTATQPSMTKSQEQAVGKAEDYLSFSAFSRKGLIQQLSSDAGEGFSKADATYAVDHITVNWNEQAAIKAKQYLEMTHFSRSGLIQQLESSYGEGFTHKQAVYGVTKAGL